MEIRMDKSIEPEYLIPDNCGRIEILLTKKLSDELIKEYEELLNVKINQDDFIFLEVCQGCGTTNWHNIPILKKEEIHRSVNKVIKLAHMINNKIEDKTRGTEYYTKTHFIWDDLRNAGYNIKEFHPEYIKLFTLVGLALIYKESYDDVVFYIGTIIDKIIEKIKIYTEREKRE